MRRRLTDLKELSDDLLLPVHDRRGELLPTFAHGRGLQVRLAELVEEEEAGHAPVLVVRLGVDLFRELLLKERWLEPVEMHVDFCEEARLDWVDLRDGVHRCRD
eukprot:4090339-Prymnesium_polylepis.1